MNIREADAGWLDLFRDCVAFRHTASTARGGQVKAGPVGRDLGDRATRCATAMQSVATVSWRSGVRRRCWTASGRATDRLLSVVTMGAIVRVLVAL